jgi:uncharacterized membrane protein YbhN (UPF0104 family)
LTEPRSSTRVLLRWLLALVLMGLAVRLLKADPEPLRRLLSTRPDVIAGLAALVVVNQFLMSWRLSFAVEQCGGRGVTGFTWFRLTSVGQFLNLFVPQLGNVYRGVVLKRDHGVSYMAYASGLVAFVWMDIVMGFVVALVVILLRDPTFRMLGLPAPLVLCIVLATLLVGPLAAARLVGSSGGDGSWLGRIGRRASTLLVTTVQVLESPTFVARFFCVSLLGTLGQVAALWLSFAAVGATVPVGALVVFQVFIKLSNQVMITPGNLGLTELTYGILARVSTFKLEQGIAAALIMRAVGMVMIILLGLLSGGGAHLLRRRKDSLGAPGEDA